MRATTFINEAADAAEVVVRKLGDAGGGRGRALVRRAMRRGRHTAT
jgi:hypothetical protein